MSLPSRIVACLLSLWLGLAPVIARTAETAPGPGTKLESLTVGATTYRDVLVRSVSVRTLVITHAGGMASIRLRDLAPEWQVRFRYDPAAETAAEAAAKNSPPPATAPRKAKAPPAAKGGTKIDALLQRFGQPAAIQAEVDLRPNFFELELWVKNQGRRPSCAIFSIVSALEYQNAELTGRPEKFSEEYLIWAVHKTVQRMPAPGSAEGQIGAEDADAGFALTEVVTALRAYGIPLQARMPARILKQADAGSYAEAINATNAGKVGPKYEPFPDPTPDLIKEAREHQRVFVHQLPGRDRATLINNLVQALNAGVPVAVGMAWPNYRSIRSGFLSEQQPMQNSGHAVTMVGYRTKTGRVEDAEFVFKNSWGSDWGQGGYGIATYGYLSRYLDDAVLLELQPGKS